jgi:hypothetical protein
MAPQKAVTQNLAYGVLYVVGAVSFLMVIMPGLQAPAILSSTSLAVGIILWTTIFSLDAKKSLKSIEHQETRNANVWPWYKLLLFILEILGVASALIVLGLYIAYYQPFWAFLVNLLIPFFPTGYLTSAVWYWRWQRRNKRTLLIEDRRMYPQPALDSII